MLQCNRLQVSIRASSHPNLRTRAPATQVVLVAHQWVHPRPLRAPWVRVAVAREEALSQLIRRHFCGCTYLSVIQIPDKLDGHYRRGAYPTNSNGLVEFSTIFPGFCVSSPLFSHFSADIIYTLVRLWKNCSYSYGCPYELFRKCKWHHRAWGWEYPTCWTRLVDSLLWRWSLQLISFRAVFFDESWSELVLATSPYNQETITRTVNDVDRVFAAENTVWTILLSSAFETNCMSRLGTMRPLSWLCWEVILAKGFLAT